MVKLSEPMQMRYKSALPQLPALLFFRGIFLLLGRRTGDGERPEVESGESPKRWLVSYKAI